jgi:hypothetical protein
MTLRVAPERLIAEATVEGVGVGVSAISYPTADATAASSHLMAGS